MKRWLGPWLLALIVTVPACRKSQSGAGTDAGVAAPIQGGGPVIGLQGSQILVDGNPAGSSRAIEELGRLQKIDELFNMLKAKRELWKTVQPNKPFPGVCILQVDGSVPALVVKSVFQTAAFAGYPNVSFMVGKISTSGQGAPAK